MKTIQYLISATVVRTHVTLQDEYVERRVSIPPFMVMAKNGAHALRIAYAICAPFYGGVMHAKAVTFEGTGEHAETPPQGMYVGNLYVYPEV